MRAESSSCIGASSFVTLFALELTTCATPSPAGCRARPEQRSLARIEPAIGGERFVVRPWSAPDRACSPVRPAARRPERRNVRERYRFVPARHLCRPSARRWTVFTPALGIAVARSAISFPSPGSAQRGVDRHVYPSGAASDGRCIWRASSCAEMIFPTRCGRLRSSRKGGRNTKVAFASPANAARPQRAGADFVQADRAESLSPKLASPLVQQRQQRLGVESRPVAGAAGDDDAVDRGVRDPARDDGAHRVCGRVARNRAFSVQVVAGFAQGIVQPVAGGVVPPRVSRKWQHAQGQRLELAAVMRLGPTQMQRIPTAKRPVPAGGHRYSARAGLSRPVSSMRPAAPCSRANAAGVEQSARHAPPARGIGDEQVVEQPQPRGSAPRRTADRNWVKPIALPSRSASSSADLPRARRSRRKASKARDIRRLAVERAVVRRTAARWAMSVRSRGGSRMRSWRFPVSRATVGLVPVAQGVRTSGVERAFHHVRQVVQRGGHRRGGR